MNPLSSEEYKDIYSKVPRLCVDLIIKTHKGIVLTRRSLPEWNNTWHLPGGAVRYGETIEQAAARTAERELHLAVTVLRPLGYIEFPSEERERGFGWAISIPLLCTPHSEEFTAGEGSSEARAFTELPDDMILEQKTFLSTHWADIMANSAA